VQRSIPEAVSEIDAEGHLGVSDRPLVAALINSVKELKAANDNLKACQCLLALQDLWTVGDGREVRPWNILCP